MKKIFIAAVFLLLIISPTIYAGEQSRISIPERYQGMWICNDENIPDKMLMEITASNLYLNGMPFSEVLDYSGSSIVDYEERNSEASYSVILHSIENDILFTGYIVFTLDSAGNLLMCMTAATEHKDYSRPQTFMLLFNRL